MENVAGTGAYGGFDQAETVVGFSVPIELGGKRSARIASADAQTGRATLMAAIVQADIRLQVTQFYIAAVAAERRLVTAQEHLRIARDAAHAARIRVLAGRASPLRNSAPMSPASTRKRESSVPGVWRRSRGRTFARRIGQPLAGPLDTVLDRLPAPDHGMASPMGSAGTLALAAADADLAVADAGVRLACSQRVPDITVGPGVRRPATNDTAAVFSLSVPLPFFNPGRRKPSMKRLPSASAPMPCGA